MTLALINILFLEFTSTNERTQLVVCLHKRRVTPACTSEEYLKVFPHYVEHFSHLACCVICMLWVHA